jgi:outer membrane protein assembly factor BamB
VRKLWPQPLVAPLRKVTETDERRHQSLTPACANGIVVCPTETGVVIAVDFAQRRLLWAYQYDSTEARRNAHVLRGGVVFPNAPFPVDERSDQGWLDGTPIIADGRVFLTPTDSDELHCLDLADGELHWKIPRERAVYLAGADHQRAVLIGPDQLDAVRVTDGSPAWTASVSIPAPTGRGLWMADRYLVPLSTGEIATIDLERGRILARSKLPGSEVPGNLAANSQFLVTLSARDVAAFRTLRATEDVIARALAADAEDPAALALRGEARLHRGDFEAGLADLRASIAKRPEPYAKSVLASALLDGLRTDFARYRDLVTELETLTDDAQQRNEFVWLVARGLKETGQSLAAFERMMHLIEQSLDDFSAEGAESAWQSRNDRRLSSLFASLYQQANPSDRAQLDAQILKWLPQADSVPESETTAALRRFLRVFGFHPSAVEARQQLVSQLDPELNSSEYAWELAKLANSPDDAVSGPATATLSRWQLERQRFHDVASLLERLEGRFAETACEPEATGRQVAEQLRADEGFVEAEKLRSAWPHGTIQTNATNQPAQGRRTTRILIVGKVPAHYQGWSFETDQLGSLLIARDEVARQRWVLQRPNTAPGLPGFGAETQPAFHRVHLGEHLVGWSAGTSFLVAADLEPQRAAPRVLWQESLLPPDGYNSPEQNRALIQQQARNMARRGMLINPGFIANVPAGAGALVAVTDQGVIYHNGRKLFAAEPLTGKLLWSRRDLSRSLLDIQADDRTVSLLSQDWQANRNGAAALQRVRTVDGESLPVAELPTGIVEWIGGSRVLVSEDTALPASGPVPLALKDIAGGEPVWRAELARPAVIRVWNQSTVFTLEEHRRLTVRSLEDGTVRWSQELSLDLKPDALFVQPWKDRFLVIAGVTALPPAQPGTPRVLGFDPQHESLSGYVLALKQDTGELVWQTPINEPAADPTAFDLSQPAGWPVLLFAGKMFVTPPAGAAVPGFAANQQRLTATFIDKETGRRIYAREEPSNAQMYFVDVDPDLNTLTANFLTWSVELRYKRRK